MNNPMNKPLMLLILSTLNASAGLSKLGALSMIESGDNDRAVGAAGEVSRYQIRPYVWRRYTVSRAYRDPRVAQVVAECHMAYLETLFLQATGRQPTDFDRYVLWNGGPTYYSHIGFKAARVCRTIRGRAERFVNLREMKETTQTAPMLAVAGPP
jgi:hypothetical protein